jgi:PAS domain S-box-containing protein
VNRNGGKEAPRPSVDELSSNGAARLRAMIEASVDCVITIDAQSTILEFNAAAERTFGYQRDHVIGKPLTEAIIPPVLREAHRREIAALLRGEDGKLLGQRVKMPAMRSDGSEFLAELTITRIGSQSPPLFTAYLHDITEQKRAEEELFRSLALLRAITEGTTDAVFAKDRQGRYLLFNTAAARFVDKSVEEVIGLDDASLFCPETAARIMERDRFVLESGETRTDEDVTMSLAGTFRIYLTTKGPLRDASGAIIGLFGIARDITERKEAEEKLRKSETRFRELAENIDEVFWVWTSNLGSARLLYVNPAYATIWGRSCESLYSSPQSWQEALHPEDRERVLAAIAALNLESMCELTYRIVRPDKSIRWISDRVFPVRNEGGVVVRFAGIARDITESKITELALETAEEQYRSIFNNTLYGIFRTSPEGKILVANPAAAHILGFASPEELIEERNDIARQGYVDPDQREVFKRLLQQHGVVSGFEYETYRKDGSHVWISENTRAVYSAGGEIRYFEGVFEDVTERKRAEQALRESEERFRTIFEQAPLGISEGEIATARLVSANQSYIDILGYSIDELRELTFKDYTYPEDLPKDLAQFRRLAAGEISTYTMEKRYVRKDGALIWANLTVSALSSLNGKPFTCIAVLEDITERKRAQEALTAQALRYNALMETSTDSIYVLDENGDLQEANAAFRCRRGYTPADLKDLNVADWDAQWDREQLRERIRKLGDGSSVFETRHRCKDGSIFDVEVCATSVRINGDRLLFCVTRDITERKQAQAALAARAREQAVVAELGKLALAGEDLQRLFDQTTVRVAETLGVEYCKVLKLLPDGSALQLVAGVGWKDGLVGQATVGAGCESQAGFTLLSQDLVIVDDLRTETRFNGPPLLHEHGVVSGLSVIIGELRNPFGVLGAHTARHRLFTTDDAHFFQSVANVLATAVQRKMAEEAMRGSERKYRDLVELTHDLVWSVDTEGRITYLSPAARRIYGREPEEMIGRIFTDFVPPDQVEGGVAHLAQLLATGDCVTGLENRVCHRDGHEVVLSANAVVVRDEAGNIIGTTGTSRDITQSKREEEKLRESETRFRQFAENIEEVFWMTEFQTSKTIYVSPAYERIWGRSCESLYSDSQAWREAIHPDDRARIARSPAAGLARASDNTYRIVRPDGTIRWIRDREFPVRDESGRVVRLVGIAQDITQSKQVAEKLEAANHRLRVLSQQLFNLQEEERRHLARELHDEIGQTLTAAKINLKIIAGEVPANVTGRFNDSVELLDRLLRQVRQLSLDLRPPLLDELGLVPTLRWLVDQQGQRAGLRVVFNADVDGLEIDPAIQTTCFRVAQEAITNIIRHSQARNITVMLWRKAGRLWLSVRDDGAGFDAAGLQRQGAPRSSLGMASMKERMALVSGGLEIRSTPRKGTEIRAWFPVICGEQSSRTETS